MVILYARDSSTDMLSKIDTTSSRNYNSMKLNVHETSRGITLLYIPHDIMLSTMLWNNSYKNLK